jgi:hypothetical protein
VQVERVVTFGQPRFTTIEGAKRLGLLPLTRIVDENDIAPMVAPSTFTDPKFGPYDQVGAEVILLEGRILFSCPLMTPVASTLASFGVRWLSPT